MPCVPCCCACRATELRHWCIASSVSHVLSPLLKAQLTWLSAAVAVLRPVLLACVRVVRQRLLTLAGYLPGTAGIATCLGADPASRGCFPLHEMQAGALACVQAKTALQLPAQ